MALFSTYLGTLTGGSVVFLAVGGTTDGRVARSANGGSTWTSANVGSNVLRAIAYGGARFVAVGDNNTIYTSDNLGVSWTSRTGPFTATQDIYLVMYGEGLYVAFTQDGSIGTSPDGVTWTLRSSPVAWTVNDVDGAYNGSDLFILLNQSVTSNYATSPDGITWTSRSAPAGAPVRGVAHDGGSTWLMADDAKGATSSDGISWSASSSFSSVDVYFATYFNGRWIRAGSNGAGGPGLRHATAPLGTYSVGSFDATNPGDIVNGVAFGLGYYVAVGGAGSIWRASGTPGAFTRVHNEYSWYGIGTN